MYLEPAKAAFIVHWLAALGSRAMEAWEFVEVTFAIGFDCCYPYYYHVEHSDKGEYFVELGEGEEDP